MKWIEKGAVDFTRSCLGLDLGFRTLENASTNAIESLEVLVVDFQSLPTSFPLHHFVYRFLILF